MIKAIIFDCFGVLVVDSWLPFKEAYFGRSSQLLRQATDLNRQADDGLITYREFMQGIARLAGIPEEDATRQVSRNPANQPLFDYIERELKPSYRFGILSNASDDWISQLFTTDQARLFDAVVLSYQIGAAKPDPRAYKAIVEELELTAEECVFVDDQQRYCDTARELGFTSIHYSNFDQFKADLEQVLSHT